MYLDVSVQKVVIDAQGTWMEPVDITDAGTVLTMALYLPDDMAGMAEYGVFRVHNGDAKAMQELRGNPEKPTEEGFYVDTANNVLYIFASKFPSYYAVTCSETAAVPPTLGTPFPRVAYLGGGEFQSENTESAPTKAYVDGQAVEILAGDENGFELDLAGFNPGRHALRIHWGNRIFSTWFDYEGEITIPQTGDSLSHLGMAMLGWALTGAIALLLYRRKRG